MPGRLSPLHVTMRQRLENEEPERGDSSGDSAGTKSRRVSFVAGGAESPCATSASPPARVFRLRFFAGPSLPVARSSRASEEVGGIVSWADPFDAPSPSNFLAAFFDISAGMRALTLSARRASPGVVAVFFLESMPHGRLALHDRCE